MVAAIGSSSISTGEVLRWMIGEVGEPTMACRRMAPEVMDKGERVAVEAVPVECVSGLQIEGVEVRASR